MQITDLHIYSSPTPGATADLELAATLYMPEASQAVDGAPGLVVGHGAGSCRTRHAEFCAVACRAGFVVLGVDFRGHGQSAGAVDGPLELDIGAAATFLRDHPSVDPRCLCYRGSSMGGFYGLKAGPDVGFAAMALLCPATETVMLHGIDEYEEPAESPSSDEGARWDIPRLRKYFENQQSLALAQRVDCPVLLIHARQDEVVPFTHTLLLVQSLRVDTELIALSEGVHTTAQHDREIHEQTVAWLKRKVTSCNERT